MLPIVYEVFSKYFEIDQLSPSFLKRKSGEFCLYTKRGYYYVGLKKKQYYAHRIIYCLHNKVDLKDEIIDHIDRNIANNDPRNLRIANFRLNALNASVRKDSESGIRGVRFRGGSSLGYWCARWKENRKLVEKQFSVKQYGYEHAKELAIEYRKFIFDNIMQQVSEPFQNH